MATPNHNNLVQEGAVPKIVPFSPHNDASEDALFGTSDV
jgi:hypothetical protein